MYILSNGGQSANCIYSSCTISNAAASVVGGRTTTTQMEGGTILLLSGYKSDQADSRCLPAKTLSMPITVPLSRSEPPNSTLWDEPPPHRAAVRAKTASHQHAVADVQVGDSSARALQDSTVN